MINIHFYGNLKNLTNIQQETEYPAGIQGIESCLQDIRVGRPLTSVGGACV